MIDYLRAIDGHAVRRYFLIHPNLDFLIRFQQTSYELIERRPDRVKQACLIGGSFLVLAVHLLLIWLIPLDNPYLRVIVFDSFLILGLPSFFKLLLVLSLYSSSYLFYRLYFTTTSLQSTREALLLVSQSKNSKILDQLSRITKSVLFISNALLIFVLCISSWSLILIVMMVPCLWPYIWPPTWLSLPNLVSFLFFYSMTQIVLALCVYSCNLAGTICVLVTLVLFAQFRSIERILWQRRLRFSEIGRFIVYHNSLVRNVLELNSDYGPMVLACFVGTMPIHICLIAATILEIVSPLTRLFFLPIIISFPIFFVGIHLMTAQYTRKIHRPYKRLASLFVRVGHKLRRSFPLNRRWRMASRIEIFQTNNPYGITYGPFGLISLSTFYKFLILYFKFVLIVYKNLKKLRNNSH